MTDLLILQVADKNMAQLAKRARLDVHVGDPLEVRFDRALIAAPGVSIPVDLVGYGMHFLERWDAAAPLWRYDVTAADVGTPSERERTQVVTRDLRVLLYDCDLLFVRNSELGHRLLVEWKAELEQGHDRRLAFLRALFIVKPIFCTLPCSWSGARATVMQRATVPVKPAVGARAVPVATPQPGPRPARAAGNGLVSVEIRPGVYVRCRPGEEESVRKRLGSAHLSRHERKEAAK